MKPKLQENPREWRKLILAGVFALGAASWLLWHRDSISTRSFESTIIVLSAVLVLCWLRPRLFRPIYRAVMTASFYVGQVMGRVLLAIFFIGALIPLALLLRLLGKDLLRLKRDPKVQSYWRPAKIDGDFDRQF